MGWQRSIDTTSTYFEQSILFKFLLIVRRVGGHQVSILVTNSSAKGNTNVSKDISDQHLHEISTFSINVGFQ